MPRKLGKLPCMSTEGARRLAEAVRARRERLDWNQMMVQSHGGPSNTKQTEVENARLERLTAQMARKLDRGLQWEPGSARRVWNGEGEPMPLLPGVDPKRSAALRRIVEESDLEEAKRAEILRILDAG